MFQVAQKIINSIERSMNLNSELKMCGIRILVKEDLKSNSDQEKVNIIFEDKISISTDRVIQIQNISFIIESKLFEMFDSCLLDFENQKFVLKSNSDVQAERICKLEKNK